MDTSSINPASIIDEAVDLSMRLAGTDFPVSIFPTKINASSVRFTNAITTRLTTLPLQFLQRLQLASATRILPKSSKAG